MSSNRQKWIVSLWAAVVGTILAVILFNPTTYKLFRGWFKQIASAKGCPTKIGVLASGAGFLVAFTLAIRGMMDITLPGVKEDQDVVVQ